MIHWVSDLTRKYPALWQALRFFYRVLSGKILLVAYYRWQHERRIRGLKKHGYETLRRVREVCLRLGLEPFLIYGTLLGHHRERGFVRHDYDIDLGFMAEDLPDMEALKNAMLEAGFRLSLPGRLPSSLNAIGRYSTVQFYDPKKSVYVDFWAFHRYGELIMNVQDRSADGFFRKHLKDDRVLRTDFLGYAMTFPKEVFSGFEPAKFLGCDFLMPMNTERFLEEAYGDWKAPHRDFRYRNLRLIRRRNAEGIFEIS